MSWLPTISRPAKLRAGKTSKKTIRRATCSRRPRLETLEARVVFSADPVSAAIAEGSFCEPEPAPASLPTEPPADYVAPGHPDFIGPLLPATHPNHNASQPADANADGLVTPLDALRLINKYNAARTEDLVSGEADGLQTPATVDPLYWDVNDDGRFTPLDVLLVVNWINTHGSPASAGAPDGGAEAEAATTAESPALAGLAALDTINPLDRPTQLTGPEGESAGVCYPKPAISSRPSETVPPTATEATSPTASNSEREPLADESDELLDILAADLASSQSSLYGPLPADDFFGSLVTKADQLHA